MAAAPPPAAAAAAAPPPVAAGAAGAAGAAAPIPVPGNPGLFYYAGAPPAAIPAGAPGAFPGGMGPNAYGNAPVGPLFYRGRNGRYYVQRAQGYEDQPPHLGDLSDLDYLDRRMRMQRLFMKDPYLRSLTSQMVNQPDVTQALLKRYRRGSKASSFLSKMLGGGPGADFQALTDGGKKEPSLPDEFAKKESCPQKCGTGCKKCIPDWLQDLYSKTKTTAAERRAIAKIPDLKNFKKGSPGYFAALREIKRLKDMTKSELRREENKELNKEFASSKKKELLSKARRKGKILKLLEKEK